MKSSGRDHVTQSAGFGYVKFRKQNADSYVLNRTSFSVGCIGFTRFCINYFLGLWKTFSENPTDRVQTGALTDFEMFKLYGAGLGATAAGRSARATRNVGATRMGHATGECPRRPEGPAPSGMLR